jgi:hypothetical protein
MSSAAKALANMANARLSTGPSTPEGKARSSQNAIRHGLTAKELIVSDDQRPAFEELRQSLLTELAPQGAVENFTFDQLLHAAWNLQRFRALEADLMVNGLDPILDDSAAKILDRLNRYAARAERSYYKALNELRTLQTNRALRALKLEPDEEPLVPAIVSINDLTKRSHAEVQGEAMRLATEMLDYQAATYVRQARHQRIVDSAKPQPAAPAEPSADGLK